MEIRKFRVIVAMVWVMFLGNTALGNIVLTDNYGETQIQVEQLAVGLDLPWGMVFLSRSEILFTEIDGQVSILDLTNRQISPIHGAPEVVSKGQGGLLDAAVNGHYQPGDWIYFTYSKPWKGSAVTTLARAKLQGNRLKDFADLLVSQSASNTSRHFGSRITFDNAGHLYFSIGDRGHRPNGQNLGVHAGSVIRLLPDGAIPEDNPFVSSNSALPEIWTYGHRNPQGLSFDNQRNILWEIEHGPRGGDEINQLEAGKNYGWATISHGKEYWGPVQVGEGTRKEGMEQPVKIYTPSIAPGSLMVYYGAAFPEWRGDLFAGALKLEHINHLKLDRAGNILSEERLIESLNERIRALIEGPEGWIYFSTDNGGIYRIRPYQPEN